MFFFKPIYCLGRFLSSQLRFARRASLGDNRTALFPLLRRPLCKQLLIGGSLLLVSEDTVEFGSLASPLSLKRKRGDEALNLGRLDHGAALLVGELTLDYVLSYIVLLRKVEQLTDITGSLGSKTTRSRVIGESSHRLFADLCNDQVQDSDIVSHDASTDTLALTFTRAAGAVALVALGAKETDTGVREYTLSHGESLLVITSRNAKLVSLKFFTENASVYFLGHTAIVELNKLLFIISFDELLEAGAGACDIDLFIVTREIRQGSLVRV